MKSIIKPITTLLLLLPLQLLLAQPPDAEEKIEKVQAAKVAYITSRLNLNTTQSQAFWPVFNEFETARRKVRFQLKGLHKDAKHSQQNEEQLKASIRKRFSLRQEELDLEKQYAEKFMKILSAEQVSELYESEKEFTKLLLNRWRDGESRGKRKGGRGEFPED